MPPRSKKLTLLLLTLPLFFLSVTPAAAWGEGLLWTLVTNLFGTFTLIAGQLLNVSAMEFVVNFGTQFQSTGTGIAVDILWVKVRDIFNLTFIFGLVYLGIKMILDSDDASTRRWLISLIMAALLVNFSLFFTKFIIDIANLTATQIAAGFPTATTGTVQTLAISDAFMKALNVQPILAGSLPVGASWSYIFGTAIVLIIMMFVFFAGAILLIIRYAVLCLYMVLSPLMFIGWVFPQFGHITKQYWSGFLGKAFFAPIYLLLLYFSYFILQAFAAGGRLNPNFVAALNVGNTAGATTVASMNNVWPFFFLVSVFLIASVVAAQKLGLEGGSGMVRMMVNAKNNVQQRVTRAARNTANRTAGFAARNTVGRGAEFARKRLDRRLGTMAQGGAFSRIAARTLDRSVGAGLRSAEGVSIGGSRTLAQVREQKQQQKQQQQQRFNASYADSVRQEQIRTTEAQYRFASQSSATPGDHSNYEELLEQQRAIGAQMNTMDGVKMAELGFDKLTSPEYAANLTDAMIAALEKTGRFTGVQVNELKNRRTQAQLTPAMNVLREATIVDPRSFGPATPQQIAAYEAQVKAQRSRKQAAEKYLGETIKGMSSERLIKEVGVGTLQDELVAQHLTDSQLDQMQKSGQVIGSQVDAVKAARAQAPLTEMETQLDGTTTSAEKLEEAFDKLGRVVKSLSGERLTGLGMQKLTNERIAMNLSDSQIDTLQNSGQYSADEIKKIKEARKRGQIAVAQGNWNTPLTVGGGSLVNPSNLNTTQLVDPSKPHKGTFVQSQRNAMFRSGTAKIGALPPEIFADPNLVQFITPQALEERQRNGLDNSQISAIRTNIDNYIAELNDPSVRDVPSVKAALNTWKKWASTTRGAWLGLTI